MLPTRHLFTAAAFSLALLSGQPRSLSAADAVTTESTPLPLVIVAGDGISVGLAQALRARIQGQRVDSWGVVGSGLLTKRGDWQARIRVIAKVAPSYVVIELGMADTHSPLPVDYAKRLTNFLEPLRVAGIPFVVLSVPDTLALSRNARIDALNVLLRDAAVQEHGGFLPLIQIPGERDPDGIHYTRKGYADLAGQVAADIGGPGTVP
jgi:hypothetical protein